MHCGSVGNRFAKNSNNEKVFEKKEHVHSEQENEQVSEQEQKNEQVIEKLIIEFCKEPRSTREIIEHFKMERSYFKRHFQDRMLKEGKLKMTDPNNIKSRSQKYFS